jgi:hypothetical protein
VADEHPQLDEAEAHAEYRQKTVAHYSAAVTGWFATRLELDKSLLTLSSGGVGLLVTVLRPAMHSCAAQVIYALALIAFIVCDMIVLVIFKRNSTHLEAVVHSSEASDFVLAFLDTAAIVTFICGVVLSAIIGFAFRTT